MIFVKSFLQTIVGYIKYDQPPSLASIYGTFYNFINYVFAHIFNIITNLHITLV
jgi:hypothetical protein